MPFPTLTRRHFVGLSAALVAGTARAAEKPPAPVALGSDRELFVDHHLIDKLTGARLQLQRPRDEGPVLLFDKPWERLFCGYCTVIKDGPLYRLYYRGYKDPK